MKRPTRKSRLLKGGIRPLEHQAAEDEDRLQTLREAAEVGIADIGEGRFRTFDAKESLRRHLSHLAEDAVSDPAAECRAEHE